MSANPFILLAEDNPANSQLIRVVLENAGYRVSVAVDGAQAVSMVETAAFDLVLMDVNMPELDGLEATRRIRAGDPASSDIPIFALTADDDGSVVKDCINAGMNGHIDKPIAMSALIAAVGNALMGKQRRCA